MISAEQLKKELSEEQICKILYRLGSTEFEDRGGSIAFKTICHNLDEHDAGFNLVYYKDSQLFTCFSECGETFDIYGLVRKRLTLEGEENLFKDNLFYFVLNHSDINYDNYVETDKYISLSDKYKEKSIEALVPEYSDKVLDVFYNRYCIEWLNDGISEETMKKYNIKYYMRQNKIVIPHYDINGRLIGIRGRTLDSEKAKLYGKYSPIRVEKKMYNHPLGLNLYGLDKVRNNIEKFGMAIIAEGEKSALQADTFLGDNNIVCSACGSSLNKWQVLLLVKYCKVKEIVLAFDREENINDKYFNKLYNMCNKYKNYCDFSIIFDEKLLELKDSPFDKGKEVFDKLIKNRVKVR